MLNCKQINHIPKIRDLGLIFVNNLRWNPHINNLVEKLRSVFYESVKHRYLVTIKTMFIIYFDFY